jgi:alpha-methylacyl-CoA racemase
VCFAPVLPMSEAKQHPHLVARGIIVEHDDIDQPAPAPRFSRTPSAQPTPAREATPQDLLRAWGVDAAALAAVPT